MTGSTADDRVDVSAGVDTDHDGAPDTLLLPDQPDLVFAVDTDRDSFADLVIEVGPDAVAHSFPLAAGGTNPFADACYADPDDLDPTRW